MTEEQLRNKVVQQARDWLGLKESNGSHREILEVYNAIKPLPVGYRVKESDPWCAVYVSAVGAACDLTDIILPECSCSRMIGLYKAVGRWMEADDYAPSPGDLIMYGWSDSGIGDYTGDPDHVGIVEERDGNDITVLEGNIRDAVGRRRITVDARHIRGYCLPDYAGKATRGEVGRVFPDVPKDQYYSDPIKWAHEQGLVFGYEDGTFRPDEPLTRGQAVTLLYRYDHR